MAEKEKTCKYTKCGRLFKTIANKQVYCSTDCRFSFNNEKNKDKTYRKHVATPVRCNNCQEYTIPNRSLMRYCSDECRNVYKKTVLRKRNSDRVLEKYHIKNDLEKCSRCGVKGVLHCLVDQVCKECYPQV